MKIEKVSNADTVHLVEAYRNAAKLHGEATDTGDHRAANKSAELIAAIYAELRRRGTAAQRELLPLLTDPVAGVQLWSASHALEFSPDDGESVLKQLSSRGPFLGLTAEMTLKEWRAGRLRFP
jgi:hypothetical protein